jgi:heavy metal sensor kinase
MAVFKPYSISFRLTLWFSSVFLLGLIIFGFVMWLQLGFSLRAGRERTLNRRADRMVDVLQKSPGMPPLERARRFLEFEQGTPEGSLIQVFDPENRRIYPASSDSAPSLPWPSIVEKQRQSYTRGMFEGQPYLVLARSVVVNGKALRVFVGGQLSDNESLLSRFSDALLATIPALLLLSALGGYFLSRRALQPVDRLIFSAREISIQNLSERLPTEDTGDELQRLAETCNDMLSRLEAAVNQLRRFTADASHELRSPISFIRTVAECALLNPEVDPESRNAFQEIIGESNQAGELLGDMLTLARADAGEREVEDCGSVNLVELAEEASVRIRPLAESRGHFVSVSTRNGSGCAVSGDRPRLRQLLWILLDNAVKYTPPGGRIEITVDRDTSSAKLAVSDTGIGIAPDQLPHIFDRFYRVDSSRGEVSGTGLGLAIAKWIAESHRATISVTSVVQRGTTFTVLFDFTSSFAW